MKAGIRVRATFGMPSNTVTMAWQVCRRQLCCVDAGQPTVSQLTTLYRLHEQTAATQVRISLAARNSCLRCSMLHHHVLRTLVAK